jgi:ATP-dependent metalloprotease
LYSITEQDKEKTAYHEGGHVIASLYTAGAMPFHKVTVMPRGDALGVTMQLPDGDTNSLSRLELFSKLDVCMGGRVAEEIIYGYDHGKPCNLL